MNFRKIIDSKIFVLAVCALFIIFAGMYYYGLQCEYPPEPEDVMAISRMFLYLTLGVDYHFTEILYDACVYIATNIGGMSYFATRLHFVLLYALLMCGTLFLCLRSKKEKKVKLYLLPLIALFHIAFFPVAEYPELFQFPNGVELIYIWPFHYHYMARIYVVICLSLFFVCMQCKRRNKKIVYGIIFMLVCLYAAKCTDLIFYIMFLAPAAIVLFLHVFQQTKFRKYVFVLFGIGMGVMGICKVLPFSFYDKLWTKERTGVYGSIYGATNWISVDSLIEHLLGYIKLNFLNFNIQLPELPVISLYTVVSIFKILILLFGYIIVFHIIICSLKNSIKNINNYYGYDYIDEILAWSYLLLSSVYIFTEIGTIQFSRYFPGLTTVMTILLCRNIEIFSRFVGIEFFEGIKYKKALVCGCMSVLFICSIGKVWDYRVPNAYEDELWAMKEYIESTQYGYALAPFWISPQIGALSDGKIMVYQTKEEIYNIYGDEAKISYIITSNEDNTEIRGNFYEHCNSYDEICEYYSEPTKIICYDKLQLVVFENGIKIEE